MCLEKNRTTVAQHIFLSKLKRNFYRGKSSPQNNWLLLHFSKTAQRKQSPNRRKFAQSGHPDHNIRHM
jgi:hypothetical protein